LEKTALVEDDGVVHLSEAFLRTEGDIATFRTRMPTPIRRGDHRTPQIDYLVNHQMHSKYGDRLSELGAKATQRKVNTDRTHL